MGPCDVVSVYLATDVFGAAVDCVGLYRFRSLRNIRFSGPGPIVFYTRFHVAAAAYRRPYGQHFGRLCDSGRNWRVSGCCNSALPKDYGNRKVVEILMGRCDADDRLGNIRRRDQFRLENRVRFSA